MHRNKKFILWFKDISNKDVPLVGGKNASLGEMYSELSGKGVAIPNGFAVTAEAYKYYIEKNKLEDRIRKNLVGIKKTTKVEILTKRASVIRNIISSAQMPKDLEIKILNAYHKFGKAVDVAVRSSATAEDLPDASFAGQQETYLNVVGREELLKSVKDCFASLFTARAISYRMEKGFNHFDVFLSVVVQKMVRSDLSSSGVMFSIDTESGFQNVVMINSIYGLGENIVQGKVNPDEFYVFKPMLGKAKNPIISKTLGDKKIKMVYKGDDVKNILVDKKDQIKFSITDKEILLLAKWAVIIEKHYDKPMDIEWAKDGKNNKLYIVQARPETVHSQKDSAVLEEYKLSSKGEKIICTGKAVGNKIGQGKANVIMGVDGINKFRTGEVLVTEMTDPDWVPVMKMAGAIVTNSGGRTCHAAIVSRELGVPCIVGTGNATSVINKNDSITVSCVEGEVGKVYKGLVSFTTKKINLKNVKKPRVDIMLNVGEPDRAFEFSFIPNDGVGLAREEFIINNSIQIHPLALLNFDKLADPPSLLAHSTLSSLQEKSRSELRRTGSQVMKKIQELTQGYKYKTDFYMEKLSEGIAKIGAAFYPKDVIVRLSDFKTDEYRNLLGGEFFEPEEDNPMLGWRGASRFYDPVFRPAFDLECKALKKVRTEMGLDNIKIMVPFCRTVEEGQKVLKLMAENGLVRGKNKLEVYVMVEIPANVILADQFAKFFDGFSIGTNDLTMLTLGLDRNSGKIANVANERDPAVKSLISQVIQTAKKHKKKIGLCGQAPSDFPEFAEFLMKQGIDSISLTPDSVIKTMKKLASSRQC